ncbi:N-6 DNA methylase [Vreelandella indica]|uniref:N-6 DNA methylase n=1 Tax=Vreelandella indica TaxID=3126500 RepID=UPI00300E3D1D|tara:strand:- start:3511 stop:6624 length:3114 start_codon:yes stop_codon:yes gene_type:complete
MVSSVSTLVREVLFASESAQNEAQLRHELENYLKKACEQSGIPWTPFQLERALKKSGETTKFADVAHGAVIVEYEAPKSFSGKFNAKAKHACKQAEEYSQLISDEEGRSLEEYTLVIWDGCHICFGRYESESPSWERLVEFDNNAAERLLDMLRENGRPLVHPQLLQVLAGPESEYGFSLIPELYKSINHASKSKKTSKTNMLFTEWKRLFSQVVGFQPENMKKLLSRQEVSHDQIYKENPAAYLFALNTYIAIIAKIVVASTLPKPSQSVLDSSVPILDRLRIMESGELYEHSGILNMLSGDFFAWYLDDENWKFYEKTLNKLVVKLAGVDYSIVKKNPNTTRDLFKGIYERFIPREVRHALGEFYTPDWLAEHGMNLLEWQPDDSLTDPTCGSGTFILEALRRRRIKYGDQVDIAVLLKGLNGIDLNPLAVLVSKASLAVFLSPFLNSNQPVRLPVYLADAIKPARIKEGLFPCYSYILQTELGPKEFSVPEKLISHSDFFKIFNKVRVLVDADLKAEEIFKAVSSEFEKIGLDELDVQTFKATICNLVSLHDQGWNGIWSAIIADRFVAGAIPPASHVCGNPPWIKWSNLPSEYTKTIQQDCKELGVFSNDRWVGGIESDISTVITYQAINHYLEDSGVLGFFLPGSVFTTPSSAGFRRFLVGPEKIECKINLVEDYDSIRPFDGVSNLPRFLVVKKGDSTDFPVLYRKWAPGKTPLAKIRKARRASDFKIFAQCQDLQATPVHGGDNGRPWLVGTKEEHLIFSKIFSGSQRSYKARKGVTADRNGIFWVYELEKKEDSLVLVENAADIGKTVGLPKITALIEDEHLFPLLRGRNVKPFDASPDESLRIIVPQRGMHGDPNLSVDFPFTFSYFAKFKSHLENRSSYKRFQKKHSFYSLWSTGDYTFSPYKVLWREVSKKFSAAYVGSYEVGGVSKIVIPDHKLYFIPVESEDEAAYLTGFLNSLTISNAVSAYASQLSLGASVADYLNIPKFDKSNTVMSNISDLSKKITSSKGVLSQEDLNLLDVYVKKLIKL